MFIGKTHSGKTTFAKRLEEINKEVLVLEADPIALFMAESFPKLRKLENKEHLDFRVFKDASLKYKIFLSLLEFSMSFSKIIVLSNSNMYERGRRLIFALAKKYRYKVIGVYFDFPEQVLVDRVKKSKRTTKILRVSKDFNELIVNQRTRMQAPDPKDFYKFYTIRTGQDLIRVKSILVGIIS